MDFLFGKKKAEIIANLFPPRTNFETLWSKISPILGDENAKEKIEKILIDLDLSSHGFRRKIGKTLNLDLYGSTHQLRLILKEIVSEKNRRPEDYLGENIVRRVIAFLLFDKDASSIFHLKDWDFENILEYRDPKRMRTVLAATAGQKLGPRRLRDLANTELGYKDLPIAAKVGHLHEFNSNRALKRYLQMVRQYPNLSVRDQRWFVRLFNSEDWIGGLALALLAPREDSNTAQLFSLTSTIFQDKIPQVEEGIRHWDCPYLTDRPAGWEDVANALNLSKSAIDAYLYYRNLLGDKFTFSKTVLEPLYLVENKEKQQKYLRQKLESDPGNEKLIKALRALENPSGRQARIHLAKENAVKTFVSRRNRRYPLAAFFQDSDRGEVDDRLARK